MTTTSLSSRGQIVLPLSIRKKMGLKEGTQFIVISDDENILLKPIKEPSLNEFKQLLEQSRQWAEDAKMTEEDIAEAITQVRKNKKSQK